MIKHKPPACEASQDRKVLYMTPDFVAKRADFRREEQSREEFTRMPDEVREGITKMLSAMFPEEAKALGADLETLKHDYAEKHRLESQDNPDRT